MDFYYQKSIQVIQQSQSPTGAYIACPNFPSYRFCWLRDGSYTAYAMDVAGEHASAEAFFRWVGSTILRYKNKVQSIRQKLEVGLIPGKDEVLHTRFTLDGYETNEDAEWGNFQIDGYGTWLWALAEHIRRTGDLKLFSDLLESIEVTIEYISLVWKYPNYDCWEEFSQYLHPYSLTCVYSGLRDISSFYQPPIKDQLLELAADIKGLIFGRGIHNGRIRKLIDAEDSQPSISTEVDASLLGIVLPYQLLAADDPITKETVRTIEKDILRPGGGVFRYKEDTYFGGGEWPLLTAWLGWFYAQNGRLEEAKKLCHWIESTADEKGHFPEQVNDHCLFPEHYEPWLNKWGPVAKPLTWSHAMYIILFNSIKEKTL